jgi:hypothetical protein
MDLQQLKKLFIDHGVKRFYAKELAPNDNSKNQPYFGGDFAVLSLLPMKHLSASSVGLRKNIKAELNYSWVLASGELVPAPHAKLILYPQYPEVRFSGFLLGCRSSSRKWEAMRALMSERSTGRILCLGVTDTNKILGFVVPGNSPLSFEIKAATPTASWGVFSEYLLPKSHDPSVARSTLIAELGRIHRLGWILSKKLDSAGLFKICNAPQCGGLTLEAELGVSMNSSSDPDFLGWEIKQHSVVNFLRPPTSKAITLMTPEPTGGYYRDHGVEAFVRKFGYVDRNGVADRLNFGGIYRNSRRHNLTGLSMYLSGYDSISKKISDPTGEIQLVDDHGVVAASWTFAGMIAHWAKKHSQAAFVPSQIKRIPVTENGENRMYSYGSSIRLAEHADSLRVIDSIAAGVLYYDPAIKIVDASTPNRTIKTRSQWRVASKAIDALYQKVTTTNV